MAYTIRIPLNQPAFDADLLPPSTSYDNVSANIHRLMFDRYGNDNFESKSFHAFTKKLRSVYVIELRNIRLKEPKPFCGQHAGPCVLPRSRPLPRSRYLEAADWIALHNAINMLLDADHVKAEIFTTRVDQFSVIGYPVSKFFIRTPELGGRKRYDYIDGAAPGALTPHYLFDPGQPSQFGDELSYGNEAEVSELRPAVIPNRTVTR